jgi:diguanylate cyclase (GGDEF)-like protein
MASRSNLALDTGRRPEVGVRHTPALETIRFDSEGEVLRKSRIPSRRRASFPTDNAVISSALYSDEAGFPVPKVARFPKEVPHGGATMPNRPLLSMRLAQAMKRAACLGRQLAVLLVGLDRFRSINDSHGHDMGDRMLCAATRRIQSVVGADGLVVRMDGDEFAVILENVLNQDQVEAAVVRLRAALAEPFHLNGRVMMTTASVGVTVFPRDGAAAAAQHEFRVA